MKGDLSRRTLCCRIVSTEERPECRTGFVHPDLRKHIRKNRKSLYIDALTFLAGAHQLNCTPSISRFGSFEGWSDAIRAPLVWAGEADPLDTQAHLRESSDPARECHERSLRAIHALMGEADFTAKEILDRCRPDRENSGTLEALVWDALSECIRGDLTSAALGRGPFKRWRDCILGGLRLEKAGKRESGNAWRVVKAVKSATLQGQSD